MRIIRMLAIVAMVGFVSGCNKTPPDLSPDAKVAFQATRVIKVLDVVRDAAIAANELAPPIISTNDTRTVVLWHRTAIQVIQATPNGWKPTVRASLYALTCDPRAMEPTSPAGPCTPQIPEAAVERLRPYVGLALVVIAEVL